MRVVAPCALALVCLSCGGESSTVAPVVPVASASAPSASSAPPSEPAVDVSEVAPPPELAVTVHVARPRAAFDKLTTVLSSLSSTFPSIGKMDLDAAVTEAAGAPIAAAIDLDQPADFAMSEWNGSGGPKMAGSVALLATPAARDTIERFYKSIEAGPRVVRLEPRDDAPDGAHPRPCSILPAYGGAARLVCGETDKMVQHLGPYLARTMTRTASSEDLRLEVFVHALREAKTAQDDTTGKDLTDILADQLVERLFSDTRSVVIEASSRGGSLDAKVTAGFSAATSDSTRAVLGLGAPGAPPALFDRLPRDTTTAWYGRGAAAADLEPLRHTLFEAVRQSSIDDGYAPDVTDRLLAPFKSLVLSGGPWAMASGSRLDDARAALDAYVAAGKTTDVARAKARPARHSWFLAGVDEPSGRWIDAAKALVRDDTIQPTAKPKKAHDPSMQETKLALRPVPAGLHLPAGTLHIEAQTGPNPKWIAKRKKDKVDVGDLDLPETTHVFVVPDGARTWIVAGADPQLAATAVLASLAGAPDAGTLAARKDLDAVRAMPASVAGFASVASVVALRGGESDYALKHTRDALKALAALSAGGTTPLPVAFTAKPGPGGAAQGGEFAMRLVVPYSLGLELASSPLSLW